MRGYVLVFIVVGLIAILSNANAQTVTIFHDSFEDGDASDWNIVNIQGSGSTWVVSSTIPLWGSSFSTYKDGQYFLLIDDDAAYSASPNLDSAITPTIDCSGYTNVHLTFSIDFEDFLGSGQFWVYVSNDGGNTWTQVWYQTDDYRDRVTIDISSVADGKPVLVKFTYYDDNDWAWGAMIDNVTVYGEAQNPPTPVPEFPAIVIPAMIAIGVLALRRYSS